jgi:hypothetical protein
MITDDFRRIALSLPAAVEGSHLGQPDFRVNGKIFATLGWREPGWGVVKLAPEHQEMLVSAEPEIFVPVSGAWGRRGWTGVNVRAADETTLRSALLAAWRTVAPKRLVNQLG